MRGFARPSVGLSMDHTGKFENTHFDAMVVLCEERVGWGWFAPAHPSAAIL